MIWRRITPNWSADGGLIGAVGARDHGDGAAQRGADKRPQHGAGWDGNGRVSIGTTVLKS
jgi:hypothetical protein